MSLLLTRFTSSNFCLLNFFACPVISPPTPANFTAYFFIPMLQDFIIFPGDADFSKVSQCTTGRVFLLKFKNSTRKFFYWMQEPKEDKDEEICKKVNDLILNPRDSSGLEGDLGGLQGLMGESYRSVR